MEYKKFKEIADTLQQKETARKDLFARNIDDEAKQKLVEDSKEIYIEASLFDLITAFQEAVHRKPEDIIHQITKEEFTIEQKIQHILQLIIILMVPGGEQKADRLRWAFQQAVYDAIVD